MLISMITAEPQSVEGSSYSVNSTAEDSSVPVINSNVVDITDKTVYSRSRYYAKAINIKIDGANVEKATEDDTTVNIVLDGFTNPNAEISVEFGTSLNRCTMSGHIGSVKLNNGEAQLVMTLTGQYVGSLKGSCTYTINFLLGEAPETLPERKIETDRKQTYNGVGIKIDLNDYFSFAKNFYLVENDEKTPLESSVYTFNSNAAGSHSLVFGASNDTGDCLDYVTVTVEVTEIKSGLWLNITTSNGSVNFVEFTDEGGDKIEGLTASLEDKNIVVSLPRTFEANGKITAAFDLTQNSDGLPKLSTSNAFNSSNDTKIYTTTLSNGMGKRTMYLYNAHPKATSNSYITYAVSYAVENETPALAENQNEPMVAEIVAGESYNLDLAPIFCDADGDELDFSVKINGEDAVSADANYSFTPMLGGTYELEFFASDFMATSADSYKVTLPSDNTAPYIREKAPKTASLNLGGTYALSMSTVFTDRDNDALTYSAKVNDSEATPVEDAYYTFTPDSIGTYTITFVAKDTETESDAHTVTLTVKEKTSIGGGSSVTEWDISGDEIDGYVNISFTDNGKRVKGESNVTYPKALGTIISSKRVPFTKGDTVADVTLRLLDAMNFTYQHTGTTKNGFYLASIGDFSLKGISYDSFGEFDAGVGSGWMITLNKTFIEYGASDFEVKNGDTIKWQYTCQLGADIGDPFYSGSSSSSSSNRNNKTKEEAKEEQKKENVKNIFAETTFADVKKDDWHYESVKYVYENNLMQGTDNGFEPESKMSRAMLVTVLYRMAKPEEKANNHNFADVPEGQWYSDAVAWATENNIVKGVSENKFAPDEDITREQMALIIYRYAKMLRFDVSHKADISHFSDADDVSDWALDAMKWANKAELVNGTSNTTLSPKATATRAQVAAILMRFCENIAK